MITFEDNNQYKVRFSGKDMDDKPKIVTWRASLVPKLSVSVLANLMSTRKEREALEQLMGWGVLSASPQGNYLVRAALNPAFLANPKPGDYVYFTSRPDAEGFALKGGRGFEVVQQGLYTVPEKIEAVDWRVMRLKDQDTGERGGIWGALIQRGILTDERYNRFSVIAQAKDAGTKQKRVILNIGHSPQTNLYFTTEEHARNYAASIPEEALFASSLEVEVVQNKSEAPRW